MGTEVVGVRWRADLLFLHSCNRDYHDLIKYDTSYISLRRCYYIIMIPYPFLCVQAPSSLILPYYFTIQERTRHQCVRLHKKGIRTVSKDLLIHLSSSTTHRKDSFTLQFLEFLLTDMLGFQNLMELQSSDSFRIIKHHWIPDSISSPCIFVDVRGEFEFVIDVFLMISRDFKRVDSRFQRSNSRKVIENEFLSRIVSMNYGKKE